MKNRLTVILSIFVTVLLLVVGLGVSKAVANRNSNQSAGVAETVAFYTTREAQYQQLITDANNTITQANQQIMALQGQDPALVSATVSPYAISLEQAIQLANTAAGGSTTQAPTLVNYSGAAAYEVVYPVGKVYIDANTGSVLYNGVMAAKTISAQQAAQIAINYTGNTQVAAVDSGSYSGMQAYRVTFNNGQIVYMNTYGTILAVQAAPAPAPVTLQESGESNDD
jgi:uncharacterized membrane protein YkoI